MARILKLFTQVHMGLGHDGLTKVAAKAKVKVAAKAKVKVAELGEDDLLMFLNTAGDKMKILGGQGKVLGYLKMPAKRVIMKEALQYIPHTFSSSGFDYDAACRAALEKKGIW